MTRKPKTINFWCGKLPHWEVEDGRYFVTMHLAGATPPEAHARIQTIAAALDKAAKPGTDAWLETHRRIFAEMEDWLDRTPRVSHLRDKRVADMVVEAVEHREQTAWRMFEYVVMPSHLHLFFELVGAPVEGDSRLKSVLEQFKRWTGHRAAMLLPNLDRFWQDEWFDHWSRSDAEDERIRAYIRRNPVKAGLVQNEAKWRYGSARKRK